MKSREKILPIISIILYIFSLCVFIYYLLKRKDPWFLGGDVYKIEAMNFYYFLIALVFIIVFDLLLFLVLKKKKLINIIIIIRIILMLFLVRNLYPVYKIIFLFSPFILFNTLFSYKDRIGKILSLVIICLMFSTWFYYLVAQESFGCFDIGCSIVDEEYERNYNMFYSFSNITFLVSYVLIIIENVIFFIYNREQLKIEGK